MPEETIDKLVIGIQDKSTEARLLREKDLSLDKALDMCKSGEITNKQLQSLQNIMRCVTVKNYCYASTIYEANLQALITSKITGDRKDLHSNCTPTKINSLRQHKSCSTHNIMLLLEGN